MKMSKFGRKSPLFGSFWARILKQSLSYLNQHLRMSAIAKYFEARKMPKYVTKNALCGCY